MPTSLKSKQNYFHWTDDNIFSHFESPPTSLKLEQFRTTKYWSVSTKCHLKMPTTFFERRPHMVFTERRHIIHFTQVVQDVNNVEVNPSIYKNIAQMWNEVNFQYVVGSHLQYFRCLSKKNEENVQPSQWLLLLRREYDTTHRNMILKLWFHIPKSPAGEKTFIQDWLKFCINEEITT